MLAHLHVRPPGALQRRINVNISFALRDGSEKGLRRRMPGTPIPAAAPSIRRILLGYAAKSQGVPNQFTR